MNKKLGLDIEMDKQVLTKDDIITIIKYLIELINSKASPALVEIITAYWVPTSTAQGFYRYIYKNINICLLAFLAYALRKSNGSLCQSRCLVYLVTKRYQTKS